MTENAWVVNDPDVDVESAIETLRIGRMKSRYVLDRPDFGLSVQFRPPLPGSPNCCFFFTIVTGTAIHSVSRIPYGIGPSHRSEACTGGYAEREWLLLLLGEYQ